MLQDLKNLILALWLLIKDFFNLIINTIVYIVNWLGPLENSVYGFISPEEFCRVLLLSFSGSSGLYESVSYLHNHANEFITDPIILSGIQGFVKHCQDKHLPIAFFIMLFLTDYIRRKYIHGRKEGNI